MSNQFKDASLHISMKFISKSKLWSLWKIKCSKKATKFCEIFILLLSCLVPSKVKTSQNFVAFSEYMNFNFKSLERWLIYFYFFSKPNFCTAFCTSISRPLVWTDHFNNWPTFLVVIVFHCFVILNWLITKLLQGAKICVSWLWLKGQLILKCILVSSVSYKERIKIIQSEVSK